MNVLSHVAIIMDGNGRWAKKRKKPRKYGHLKGTENLKNIIDFSLKQKIKNLTLFAFGIDNWRRPTSETSYIFSLLENFLKKNLNILIEKNVKINFIGESFKLNNKIKKIIKKIQNLTKDKTQLILTVAVNYSSRHELTHVVNKFLKKKLKKIKIEDISSNLYTSALPDPDILIRTGGYKRLSNFLLWQCSYTEFFFEKKLWPDFNNKDYYNIILKYKKIKRNFGSI